MVVGLCGSVDAVAVTVAAVTLTATDNATAADDAPGAADSCFCCSYYRLQLTSADPAGNHSQPLLLLWAAVKSALPCC